MGQAADARLATAGADSRVDRARSPCALPTPTDSEYCPAASAFGIGAARKNGHFDRAYPLAAEMFATVGELLNGVLAIPRLLSNLSDAPMLGEAAILCQLTIQPERGFTVKSGGSMPAYVYILLITPLLIGALGILQAVWRFREARCQPEPAVWAPKFQMAAWVCFVAGSIAGLSTAHGIVGMLLLMLAVMLPIVRRKKAPTGIQDWPDENPFPPAKPTNTDVVNG